MLAYRVRHKASGSIYHLLAASPSEAIERVTLLLEDPEGMNAFDASPDRSGYGLTKGIVLDGLGRSIHSIEG